MNRDNLLKMARYLWDLDPSKFDMGCFSTCIMGHTLTYGLCNQNTVDTYGFWGLMKVVYGLSDIDDYDARVWLFRSSWKPIDNTPRGAAQRILWFLENGVPENYHKQMTGKEELCYKNMELVD